jgi:hypothetical protein
VSSFFVEQERIRYEKADERERKEEMKESGRWSIKRSGPTFDRCRCSEAIVIFHEARSCLAATIANQVRFEIKTLVEQTTSVQ